MRSDEVESLAKLCHVVSRWCRSFQVSIPLEIVFEALVKSIAVRATASEDSYRSRVWQRESGDSIADHTIHGSLRHLAGNLFSLCVSCAVVRGPREDLISLKSRCGKHNTSFVSLSRTSHNIMEQAGWFPTLSQIAARDHAFVSLECNV